MKRHKVFATLVVLGIVGLVVGAIVIAQQQITLTTYYPSPYGEYKKVDIDNVNINDILTLAPASPLPAPTGSPGTGQIYYEGGGSNKLKVSENGSVWTDLVGGNSAWTRNTGAVPATLYPTDPTDVVGIGTSTPDPAQQLHVVGTGKVLVEGNPPRVDVRNPTGGAAYFGLFDGSTNREYDIGYHPSNFFFIKYADASISNYPFKVFGGGPADSLVVRDNGRVGIGTVSPQTTLHLQVANPTLYLESTAFSQGGRIILEDADGSGCTLIIANNGSLAASTIATCP